MEVLETNLRLVGLAKNVILVLLMKKDVCYFKECVRGFVVNITKRFHIRNYFLIIMVVTKQSYILTLIQKRKMLFGSNFPRNVFLLHSKLFPLCLQ